MSDALSTNVDVDVDDTVNCAGMDMLIVRARCCRDWPVLALARMGRCGYCGQIPVDVPVGPCVCGHPAAWHSPGCIGCGCPAMSRRERR